MRSVWFGLVSVVQGMIDTVMLSCFDLPSTSFSVCWSTVSGSVTQGHTITLTFHMVMLPLETKPIGL